MNCEMAEGSLSAYLDDKLDPQLSQDVKEHVEHWAHCEAVLSDYRRYDGLLARAVRMSPSPELRGRLFNSPELAALIGGQSHDDQHAAPLHRLLRPPAWARTAWQAAAVL